MQSGVAAAGRAECDKPLAQRKGAWMCPVSPSEQRKAIERKRAKGLLKASPQASYCFEWGCWYVYDTVTSDFSGDGWFGWGDETLGLAGFFYEVKLNGAQSISKPVIFSSSVGAQDVIMEGERLYYSTAHPEGAPVSDGATRSYYGPVGPVPASQEMFWEPNGYKAYENTVAHGSVVHQWSWTMSGYPGNWWAFAKSAKFDMTPSSYRFTVPSNLGQEPLGAAWSG